MPVLHFLNMFKTALTLSLLLAACMPRTERDEQIAAAALLTDRCAASRLAKWNIRGRAGGADCKALLVDTSMVLDDALVEAIHYGSGPYAVVDGGVRRFTRDHAFDTVVYRDRTGRVWTYGDLARGEAKELQPCR